MPDSSEKSETRTAVWWVRSLRAALMAISLLAIALFLAVAWQRLHFAYEYDWIEDGMLACLRRIHSGQSLYVAPSVFFTPYLYTPVYLYLASLLAKWMGVSYATLRLLSIVSTLGSFAAIYMLVWTETRRHFAAFAAAGLFAACYPAVEGSFDVGRVDALCIFLVLCALFATRRLHPLLAALLWVCAFQTKQGVLPIALLALCYEWRQPRRLLLGVGGFVAMLGLSVAWMTHATEGWYRYYVFGIAGGFAFDTRAALHFIPDDLLKVCGIAIALAAIAMQLERAEWRRWITRPAFNFYALGTVGMVLFTGYVRAHRGANTNTLIPAYAWIAVLFGVALGRLHRWLETRHTSRSAMLLSLTLLLGIVQIAQLYYSYWDFTPSDEEFALRNALEGTVRSIPGDVLVLSHPEYARMASKTEYASSEATGAVIEASDHAQGDRLIADYAALIHSGKLSAVVLDWPAEQYLARERVWMPRDFAAQYPLHVAAIGGDARRFTSQPRWIYLPCPAKGALDVARTLDPKVDESACTAR